MIAAALAGYPGVTLATYPVRGGSIAAFRASLDAARPVDANDGEPVEAVTHWHFTWQWPEEVGGGCDLSGAQVTFAATVTLPRLVNVDRAAPAVRAA